MDKLLEIKGICTEFKTTEGYVRAVDNVDFSLDRGMTLGIVGESGCGKSVTAMSLLGLLPKGIGRVCKGEIWFNGRNLLTLSEREMRRIRGNEIAMVFQEPMSSLNPVFKIGNQMYEVIKRHKRWKKKQAMEEVIHLLKEVGISRPEVIVKNYPHELSGGMLQRVMIAMGLACEPKLLIADEPTTALDVTIQAQILDLMAKLKEKHGAAILLITHNLGVVAETCDRVAIMYAGNIVEETDVTQLFDDPRHPYTIGLMSCVPKLGDSQKRLKNIQGIVPSLADMPEGCRFSTRCPYCTEKCRTHMPELLEIQPGHKCRCFFPHTGGLVETAAVPLKEREK